MKYLTPNDDTLQVLKFIPREYTNLCTLTLRDDQTNETTSYDVSAIRSGNYSVISEIINNLKEGHFYDLKIYNTQGVELNDLNIIYRDKVFSTDQSINQVSGNSYTINKDGYKSQGGNNDFIIL